MTRVLAVIALCALSAIALGDEHKVRIKDDKGQEMKGVGYGEAEW